MAKPGEDRRARFVQEYAKDLNGTQAAIRAGYSERTAAQQASRLLRNVQLRAEVEQLLLKVARKNEITVERTQQEIARIAYADARKLYGPDGNLLPIPQLDDDTAATIAGVEVDEVRRGDEEKPIAIITRKVKRWDKGKALEQCMSILGMHKSAPASEAGSLSLTINLSGGKKLK